MKKLIASLLLFSLMIGADSGAVFAQTVSKKTAGSSAVEPPAPVLSPVSSELIPQTVSKPAAIEPEKPIAPDPSILPLIDPLPDLPKLDDAADDLGANQAIIDDEPVRDPAEPGDEGGEGGGQLPLLPGANRQPAQYDFLKNFAGSFSTDIFTGAATFQYPLWTPAGRLGMTPALALSYSTNDSRFDSLAGYGWSLPGNAIYRSTRRGVDQLFSRNDFTADINGAAQELIAVDAEAGLYGAKIESGFTKYEFSDNQWIATDAKGVRYIFGASAETRQADPADAGRVYKWLLERAEDLNGNFIAYSYFNDRGQVYPAAIRYTGHGNEAGIFEIRFVRTERPGIVSYERGFKTETRFIIGGVEIYSHQSGRPVRVLSYRLDHEARNNAIQLLNRIQVIAENDPAAAMPPVAFEYYSGAENDSGKKINFLKAISFPYGARQEFSYQPSTTYRLNNGALASKLPFAVFTLRESRLYPAPDAAAQTTGYVYEGGHYYFDRADAFKKEYAGFHSAAITDPAGSVRKIYFHQSEFAADNDASAQQGEFQDHISKKGRIYREEQYDNANRLFQKTVRIWDKAALPDNDPEAERFFVSLRQEITADYDGNNDYKARAVAYQYDDYGNVVRQTDFGEVSILNERGDFSDSSQDRTETEVGYALNRERNILSLPSRWVKRDFILDKVGEAQLYYDGLSGNQVSRGNETRRETRVLPDGGDPLAIWAVSRIEYDAYGLAIRSVNPRGFASQTAYDRWHLYPISSVNAKGQISQSVYDPVFGVQISAIDPNGSRQIAILDGLGRVRSKSVSNPEGGADILTTSFDYRLENYPRSIRTIRHFWPNALIVDQWQYLDGLGREIQTRSQMENNQYSIANKFYDERGNLKKETLPVYGQGGGFGNYNINAVGNSYEYDALGRTTAVSNPLGTAQTVYDQWIQMITDPNDQRKDLVYDAAGRLIQVNEYLGNAPFATSYQYNANGNLIKLINAKGEIVNLAYDLAGRKTRGEDWHQPNDPTFGVWQYAYDANGNNISLIKPDGTETRFSYDELDRILTETSGDNEISYVYDLGNNGIGRLASVAFPGGGKEFSYDILGRIIDQRLSVNIGEEAENFDLAFSYDIQGNIVGVSYPNGVRVRNVYNDGGLLEQVFVRQPDQEEQAVIAGVKYLPNGFVGTREFANGIAANDQYPIDQMYRLARRTTKRAADNANIQDIAYEYDAVGNILRIVDSSATAAAKTADYQYDGLYRLTRAEITNAANNENYVQQFAYDITGNILSFAAPENIYEYAGGLALANDTFASPQAITRIGAQTFAYDRNGNLAEQLVLGSGWVHDWDWKDRLVVSRHFVPDPLEERRIDQEVRYGYDDQKERILKNDITNGEITIYDDKYFDKEGNTEKAYIYAGDVKVVSLEISPNDQGEPQAQLSFHHTDHLTSSNVDTDSDGQVVQLLDYFPYGKTRIDDHAEDYANDYQFTGKERDQETDLSYFEARYYDSSIGRFISQDPAFKDSPENFLEDPQQLNPYSYARNNPLRYNDPSGESIEDIRQRLDAIHAWALDLQRQINEFANNAQQAVFNGFVGLLPQVQENPMVNNPQNRMFANYQGQLYINPAVGSTAFGLAAIMAGSKTVPASRATGLLDIAENRLLSAAERKIISDSIQDQKLRNIFNEFYQSSDALPGGTAGAIKHTVKTGELVHGSDHFIKGDGFVNGLNKLLQNFSLNQEDRAIAQKLFDQLKNSKK